MRLHVDVAGPPDGVPVVFLHGVSGSMRTYAWLPEEVTEGRRIVRVDLRGHGRSAHAPGAYDVDSYGEDVVRGAARDGGPPRRARRPFAGRRGRLVGGPGAPRARDGRLPGGPAAVHGRAGRARAQRRGPHLPDHPRHGRALEGRGRRRRRGRRPAGRGALRPGPLAHVGRGAGRRRARRARRGAAADGPRRAGGSGGPLDARPHRHHLARLGARLRAGRRRREGLGLPDAPRRAPGHLAPRRGDRPRRRRRPRHPRRARPSRRLRRRARGFLAAHA